MERVDNMKYLPCMEIRADVNDDYSVEKKYLPGEKIGVLIADYYFDGDNNKHLPSDETGTVVDDENNGEMVTYLIMTKNTKGELTINDADRFYDRIIMGDNPINYYYGIMDKVDLNGHYAKKDNIIMYVNKTEMCKSTIRLIFYDGG